MRLMSSSVASFKSSFKPKSSDTSATMWFYAMAMFRSPNSLKAPSRRRKWGFRFKPQATTSNWLSCISTYRRLVLDTMYLMTWQRAAFSSSNPCQAIWWLKSPNYTCKRTNEITAPTLRRPWLRRPLGRSAISAISLIYSQLSSSRPSTKWYTVSIQQSNSTKLFLTCSHWKTLTSRHYSWSRLPLLCSITKQLSLSVC